MRTTALALALVFATTGCLSRSHVIPKNELMRLAQLPPEERGRQVRVVQGFQSEDNPPAADNGGSVGVVVVSEPGRGPGPGPASGGHDSAKAKSDRAYVYLILAAALGITLAVTEGARYDGWVELHPQYPIHLRGPYGEYTWMPLSQLDPQTAAWASKAIVRPGEGPWRELGRAPLNRRGLTYAMTLGYAKMPSVLGNEEQGVLGHITFGFFPEQTVGLGFDIGLGWATNDDGNTIVDSRYTLEVDFLPLTAGKLHAGGYGQGGVAGRFEDGPSSVARRGMIYGGGVMGQIELTARLALTMRAGVTQIFDYTSPDVGVGIAVY